MAIRNILKPLSEPTTLPASLSGESVLTHDTDRPSRIALWALGIGFGGFLLWAAFAPLDEGVPAQATVAIDTKRKAVQHLTGGIVREVLVREGQIVKANEVLMRLDVATTRANYESVRQHYLGVRAMESRLKAEQMGQSRITFHPDLTKLEGDSVIKEQMSNQEQLFESRRLSQQAELQGIAEIIQGQIGQLEGYQGMLTNRNSQLALLQEEIVGIRGLVAEGYAPRNKQMELERSKAEINASIAETQGNIVRSKRAIAESKMRAIQRKQEYRKEVDGQLAEIRREVQADSEKLTAVSEDMARIDIRAPADGQVVGLTVQSVGAIIQSGQKLMDIVPNNEMLLLEAKIAPHLIDRIHPGLLTDVRFSAFAHSPQLVLEGKVDSISGDLLIEPQTNQPYYLARVSITPEGMKELGKSRLLQPGMPAEVVVKTGERSMLTYLLHPLIKRLAGAMKEE